MLGRETEFITPLLRPGMMVRLRDRRMGILLWDNLFYLSGGDQVRPGDAAFRVAVPEPYIVETDEDGEHTLGVNYEDGAAGQDAWPRGAGADGDRMVHMLLCAVRGGQGGRGANRHTDIISIWDPHQMVWRGAAAQSAPTATREEMRHAVEAVLSLQQRLRDSSG